MRREEEQSSNDAALAEWSDAFATATCCSLTMRRGRHYEREDLRQAILPSCDPLPSLLQLRCGQGLHGTTAIRTWRSCSFIRSPIRSLNCISAPIARLISPYQN